MAILGCRGTGLARPLASSPFGGWRPQADSGGAYCLQAPGVHTHALLVVLNAQ